MMKLKYLAATALALGLFSCNLLDKEPSDSWNSSEAIRTYNDLVYAVNGVYESQTASMEDGTNPRGSYAGDFTLYADMRGSDYQNYGTNKQAVGVWQYTATANGSDTQNFYKRFYLSLARINKILEQLKTSGLSEDESKVKVQVGELYALRALFHFDLARLYAKLPSNVTNPENEPGIILSTETHDASYIGTRASLKKTYETILNDLQTALDKLKDDGKSKNDGHINYWAALALRARVYLYMDGDKNELALADAQEIIEEGTATAGYRLYTPSDYASAWAKEFTDESLFELQVTSLYNPQRNSLGFYTHATGYAEAGISSSFKAFMDAQPDGDVRKQLVQYEIDGQSNEGYYTQKYPGRDGQIYVNNPKVIRLSEVYLIAAEAALKSGIADPAVYLEELRRQRFTGGYQALPAIDIDDILNERRLELNGEGHMAWDMWRNKKPVNNASKGKVEHDSYLTVLPIPQAEINISHGALQQNQGYN